MPQVCLYFHLHQPYRLKQFNVFELDRGQSYFSTETDQGKGTHQIFLKVAEKSYLPMLSLLKQLLEKNPRFKLSLSCSGVFLEQAELLKPEIIELIKDLTATGRVELLTETYYHSLSFLHSKDEFIYQIVKQSKKLEQLFGVKPSVFRNTELIYSNQIAEILAASPLEFDGILTEAVQPYLQGHKKTEMFSSVEVDGKSYPLLLKHAQLSDDIAFRFSDRSWLWHPLTVDRYLQWVEVYPEDEYVNLFMDFETFGEHQWSDTGIFEFFQDLIERLSQKDWNRFVTPSEVFAEHEQVQEEKDKQQSQAAASLPVYDVPDYISWADVDRDLTAWIGNQLQSDALRELYELRQPVLDSGDEQLIEDWRRLQVSDHFYYMCTKWSADGDVHAYFSPYQSPLEAYRRYSVVLADLRGRLL